MGIKLRIRQYNDKTDLTMKISAIFVCAAAATTTVSRHARSQSLFEEILDDAPSDRTGQQNYMLHLLIRYDLMDDVNQLNKWPATESLANTLTSYGCWCQIRNQAAGGGVVPGHGQPVDELDRLCRKWHQCRSCTTIDSADGSCDPNTTLYHLTSHDD